MQFRHYNLEYFHSHESFPKKLPTFASYFLDWCKSGKKEKRTSPAGEGNNNGCGCRRKSHRKSKRPGDFCSLCSARRCCRPANQAQKEQIRRS